MNKRLFILVIAIILILAGVGIFLIVRKNNSNKTAQAPVLSVSAFNQTKNTDTSTSTVSPSDVLVFSLNAENQSNKVVSGYIMEVDISGLSTNSTLIDAQGASYNSANNSLVWTPQDIPANASIQKQFKVSVNTIPASATSAELTISFNNKIQITVAKPQTAVAPVSSNPQGHVGGASFAAPTTGVSLMVPIFLAGFVAIGLFLKKLLF